MSADWRAHLAALPTPAARSVFLAAAVDVAPPAERPAMHLAWLDVILEGVKALCRERGLPTFDPATQDELDFYPDPWAEGF